MQCTFAPQINNAKYNMRRPDIITQTKNWQLQKEKQLQANEVFFSFLEKKLTHNLNRKIKWREN
mgnify:CR=1 FL=1